MERRPILIAGPTASGKSALAMDVARRIGGVVVNADSMQVYRELRILTARPDRADEAEVPHALYGHVPAAEGYTVARWLADVAAVLADAAAAGRTPVIVGGTGLYFTALTEGLSDVPPIPAEVRTAWRDRAASEPASALHAELARRDPAMAARLSPADAQRVVRALEVLDATGRSLSSWQAERRAPLMPPAEAETLVIAPDRAVLHERIAERFRRMVVGGGLDEARAVAELGLDPSLPAMKAIGVPEMIAAATGARPLDAAVEAAIAATRRYAKRQETWFRNQFPNWTRIPPPVS
jgi:tRNA dimethylallyltransferase